MRKTRLLIISSIILFSCIIIIAGYSSLSAHVEAGVSSPGDNSLKAETIDNVNNTDQWESRSHHPYIQYTGAVYSLADNNSIVLIVEKKLLDNKSLSYIRNILLDGGIVVFTDRDSYIHSMKSLRDIIPGYYYTNVTDVYAVSLMKVNPLVYGGKGIIIYGISGEINLEKINKVIKDVNMVKTLQSENNYQWIWVLNWSSDNGFYPYGKLNIEHRLGRVVNENIPGEDWYFVRATTQVVPGIELGLSNYRTDWVENKYVLTYNESYMYHLTDYDPTSIYNVGTTIGVSLGGTGVTGSVSWTYPGSYILSVTDHSDFGTDIAWWTHDLYQPGPVQWIASSNTVKIEPGFLFRVNPLSDGTQLWIIKAKWIEPDSMGLPGDYAVRAVAFTIVFNLYS